MITTLCYLEKDNKYLMLHRTKKEICYNLPETRQQNTRCLNKMAK